MAAEAEGKVCLEVGSFFGRSSIAIASVAEVLHCIDWHRGESASDKDTGLTDSLPEWWANIRRYGFADKTVMHVGTTAQVCPFMASQRFAFCFIDADHTYEGVKDDIVNMLPLMRPDATLLFHDYTWTELGVQQAVDEFFPAVEVVDTSALVRLES